MRFEFRAHSHPIGCGEIRSGVDPIGCGYDVDFISVEQNQRMLAIQRCLALRAPRRFLSVERRALRAPRRFLSVEKPAEAPVSVEKPAEAPVHAHSERVEMVHAIGRTVRWVAFFGLIGYVTYKDPSTPLVNIKTTHGK